MRAIALTILLFVSALPARADLAPDPTDVSSPEGAIAWVAVAAAIAALALIWWRRKR